MALVYATLAVVGLLVFLILQPRAKALIAFVLMMQCFDVLPNIIGGFYVWDYGAILMMLLAVDVFRKAPISVPERPTYVKLLSLFCVWMLVCLIWSLVGEGYPWLHTLKSARNILLGYLMTYVYIRLFEIDPGSLEYLFRWIYRITFALMPVVLFQDVSGHVVLFGLTREFLGELRSYPVFLPLCMLMLWGLLARMIAGERLRLHETLYVMLSTLILALSYTRGIYVSTVVGLLTLVAIMIHDQKASSGAILRLGAVAVLGAVVLFAVGVGSKVVARAGSAYSLLSVQSPVAQEESDDTFHGRLGLAEERFRLVWDRNPLVGFGFIHEDDVPANVRENLRYGTPLNGTADDPEAYTRMYAYMSQYILGFYTADIAWADIVICTGYVGVLLMILVLALFLRQNYRSGRGYSTENYPLHVAIYVQVAVYALLSFDGNGLYSPVHVPAMLLASYAALDSSRIVGSYGAASAPNLMR